MADLDAMEGDFEDNLADVKEESNTKYMVEGQQKDDYKDDDKDEDQEADTSISYTNQSLHATVHDSAKDNNTDA